jgi:hypothetical protein
MSAETSGTLSKVGDQYTNDAMICSTCRGFLIRPDEAIVDNAPASYRFEQMFRSAVDGCPLCRVFYLSISQDDDPETLDMTAAITFEKRFASFEASDKLLAWKISLKTNRDNGPERVMLNLERVLSYGITSRIHDESPFYYDSSTPILSVKTPISRSYTGDQECMDQVAVWLQDCMENHASCNAGCSMPGSAIMPTRLLDTGASGVKLIYTAEQEARVELSYITVSHKWMIQGMPKLLKCNVGAMHQDLNSQMLPAVFHDAIVLARALNIRFVWIDALCIVQDDPADLETEISNMGHIYRNAILNVGALEAARDASPSPTTGLFVNRDPVLYSPFALTIQRVGFENNYLAFRSDGAGQLRFGPLMRRGWVLQERLLSRRSVYFGKQLLWECGEKLASETLPTQLMGYTRHQSLTSSFRITGLLSTRAQSIDTDWDVLEGISLEANYIYQNWARVVRHFSSCKLSFEQDYLVALSGLAQEFRATLNDEYYAGLWAKDMIRGLLWHRCGSRYKDCGDSEYIEVRPKMYRGMLSISLG